MKCSVYFCYDYGDKATEFYCMVNEFYLKFAIQREKYRFDDKPKNITKRKAA